MANAYHQIYLQTVFAVKYRNAIISKDWRPKILGVIGNLINEANCKTIIVNGVEDHEHCFIGLKPIVSISELMKIVKAKSSKYINDHSLMPSRFEWRACLPKGSSARRQDTVHSPIAIHRLTMFLSTFRTRKNIIRNNPSGQNIVDC